MEGKAQILQLCQIQALVPREAGNHLCCSHLLRSTPRPEVAYTGVDPLGTFLSYSADGERFSLPHGRAAASCWLACSSTNENCTGKNMEIWYNHARYLFKIDLADLSVQDA